MIEKFLRDGWCIVDFNDPALIRRIRQSVEDNVIGYLDSIHHAYDDDSIKKLHITLSEFFWAREYSLEIAKEMLAIVQQLLGFDVMVQYYPYVRIARPGKLQDNIGYHKDTQYGQTPYELAVHIPLVDLDEKSAIRIISGSHVMPESVFPKVTADGHRIEKGSIENRIGRPYLPKNLLVPEGMETTPLVMKVGQSGNDSSPAIFHGQEINEGEVTRVSCDLRFVSSRHADKVRVGKTHAGYVSVSQSPVEKIAKQYFGVQNGN